VLSTERENGHDASTSQERAQIKNKQRNKNKKENQQNNRAKYLIPQPENRTKKSRQFN